VLTEGYSVGLCGYHLAGIRQDLGGKKKNQAPAPTRTLEKYQKKKCQVDHTPGPKRKRRLRLE